MLTKSEYSTSTTSMSSVFSGSLIELNSELRKSCLPLDGKRATTKLDSFKSRLRDRINVNRARIDHLEKTIEASKIDLSHIEVLKKSLFENQMIPLVTFVDHITRTTDNALLSMQRELAKKDKDLEYVVYDRHVICLDHKFTSEESSYQKQFHHSSELFKKNFLDKENKRFKKEAKHSEKLLKEGEDLMISCKQKIDEKNETLMELKQAIRKKEDVLTVKIDQLNQLNLQLSRDIQGSTQHAKAYVITSKMKNLKQDIRRLRNEKLDYEGTELSIISEIDKMKKTIRRMGKRNNKELTKVNALENLVDSISTQINEDIEKHSLVDSSEVKLKTYLDKEKETKEKLLKEVNNKKKHIEDIKSLNSSKTSRKIDWNRIEADELSYCCKSDSIWKDEHLSTKSEEESKLQLIGTDENDKPNELNSISFDLDCEFTQSDSRLPIGVQFNCSKPNSQCTSLTNSKLSKPVATSSQKRSKFDIQRQDTEGSDSCYWSCNKILEEADEDSTSNLTPRLSEECERVANLLEEAQSNLYLTRESDCKIVKDSYASKITLETEVSSECKFDSDSQYAIGEEKDKDHQLSLSIFSTGETSVEEKFVSPSASSSINIIPRLNLSMVKRMDGSPLDCNNTVDFNYNSSDSKFDKSKTLKRSSVKTTVSKYINSNESDTSHTRHSSFISKSSATKSPTKALNGGNSQYFQTYFNKLKKNSIDVNDKPWKESKTSSQISGFSGGHWDFNKNKLSKPSKN